MNITMACMPVLLLLSAATFSATNDKLLTQLESTEDAQVALKLVHQLQPEVESWPQLDQGRFYVRMGVVQEDILHNINQAGASFNRALKLLGSLRQPSQALADAYYERSYIKYIRTHDTAAYCPDREKAVALTRRLNHPEVLVKYLASLAFCYTDTSAHFQQGLALLDEAMTLAEKYGLDADKRGMIYNATELLYKKNQLYDRAYDYAQLAYKQWASIPNVQGMQTEQHNSLLDAINLGDMDAAETHGKELLKLANDSPDHKDFKFFAYHDNGRIALAQKNFPAAIQLFNRAKAEEKNTEETMFIALNRALLANAYFMNGNTQTALREAAIVPQLPGYTSLESGDQQRIQALLQFQRHNAATAMRILFNLVTDEQDRRRQFLKTVNRNEALQHDNRLQEFEKRLLEKQLQIQQLQLSAEQRQQETSRWYLLLASATAVSLALLVYTLLRSRRRFRLLAQTDALTGIANRRNLFDFAKKLTRRARQQQSPTSLLVLDIDHFKRINDTFGHQAGDSAIKHVSAHVLGCLRERDMLGRTGGEEFAAILPDTDTSEAWQIAERIRLAIEHHPLSYNGDQIHITVSIGLVTGKLATNDPDSLLQMADNAMYHAKLAGRNRSHLAHSASTAEVPGGNSSVATHVDATMQTEA